MTGMTERIPRIFVDEPLSVGERYTLGAAEHRHVTSVLRLKAGAELTLFDGRGGEFAATIEELERNRCLVRPHEHRSVESESPLPVRLAQAISRGERTDYAIQKAVELGVTSIVPVLTRRGMVRLEGARAQRRHEHWQAVIVSACQQCGRNRIPELSAVVTLSDWLGDYTPGALDLVMEPVARNGIDSMNYEGGLITLLVGPEGGLEPQEIDAAKQVGFHGIRLGPRTLRTETAAVAGVTAVQLKWGDLNEPQKGK